MNSNPVWNAAAVGSITSALITLLVSFGVPLTAEQQTAVIGFVAVVSPFAVAFFAAGKVTSLADPRAEDGTPLSGPNGEPTDAQVRAMAKGN